MVLSPQLLVTGLLVGGLGIGVPVYFVTSKNSYVNSPRLVQLVKELPIKTSENSEFIQEMRCGVLGNNATNVVSSAFLKEQKQKEELYSLASCANTNVDSENHSLLGISWDALIPKDVLKKTFSHEGEGQFAINFKTILGDKNSRYFVTSVIGANNNASSVKVRWVDVLDTKHLDSRKVILTKIEGGEQEQNDIYLILNSTAKTQVVPAG